MGHNINPLKITVLVLTGNILEYYDFLLFMHLGPFITPLFFPGYSSKETHFLSMLLFGMAFVIRPIGGFIFGRISDLRGRKKALVQSVKWAIFPAFALALLPTYETAGISATFLFVFLRLMQGIALGGEYPNAGTYLMEYYKKNHGFISSLLAASGTVGSIIGFGLAYACSLENSPEWLWRLGFLLGGVGGIFSFHMRKILIELPHPAPNAAQAQAFAVFDIRLCLVVLIGMLVGTSLWLPMTYSNFYITKILGLPSSQGLLATFISLSGYIIFVPIWGFLSDRFDRMQFMMSAALFIIPMCLLSFYILSNGDVVFAQIGLIFAASAFGAPIHAVMNILFPVYIRGRMVALLFMVGLSLGGIAPSIAGYIVDKTGFQYAPAILISMIALATAFLFHRMRQKTKAAFMHEFSESGPLMPLDRK
jgi:MFS transporter, MHS family, proline/betaine transporter